MMITVSKMPIRLGENLLRIGPVLLGLVLTAGPQLAWADEPAAEQPAPDVAAAGVELTVDPAAEPIPALKLRLLPPIEEQVPGNAVPIYLRLVHEQNDEWRKKLRDEPEELNSIAISELSPQKAGEVLDRFSGVLDELSAAARRSDAEWDYVLENRDPLTILLPDAQSMRGYARLLALKARYEMRIGNQAAARGALEDGIALGRHVARAPFLVNQLIGIAIDGVMLEQVDALVQQPGAENLYWALAMLPRPLVSLERGLATERQWFVLKFPELAHPDRIKSSGEWQRLARAMHLWAFEVVKMEIGDPQARATSLLPSVFAASHLADVRRYLHDDLKLPEPEVAAMSIDELQVRFMLALFQETADGWQKWFFVPYSQSLPVIADRIDSLRESAKQRELYPLVSVLTPMLGNVLVAQARLDRQVARLQAIEVLRMHAAATGSLPEKLDDVTIVPVPLDPATGGPFLYTREGDVGVLDVTDEVGMKRADLRFPVRIRLRPKS